MCNKGLKIGVLGSGIVGQVLAGALLSGHPVILGTGNPSKAEVAKWQGEHHGSKTGTFADTAAICRTHSACS